VQPETKEQEGGGGMARVLVAVALSDEEARALEEIARRKGEDLATVLEEALRLYVYHGTASTSSRPVYSSQRAGRIPGTVSP
jgi:hypothetical protein